MVNDSAWKIALIDDEEDIREVLSIFLQDAGFNVKTAADGTTGLELCKEFAPQIVITDIRMSGFDGLQVLVAGGKKSRQRAGAGW